ncbi:DUF1295 domain-containing protein [Maricaulis sp. CAU 1757]
MAVYWQAYGANLVLLLALMSFVWLMALRTRDVSIVDVAWPLGFAVVVLATAHRADWNIVAPHYAVIVMVLAWSFRLAFHLYARWRNEGPDRRYEALLKRRVGPEPLFTLVAVFWFQAVALWVVALPIQAVFLDAYPRFNLIGIAGYVLFAAGFAIEVIADRQLVAFRHDEARQGQVLDSGLWRWSRHPNYFGEACVHWGFWLIAVANGTGWWTIIGPAFLTFTLIRWSGVPMVEAHLEKSRPGYAEYKRRTSMFVPWPPKKD